MHGYTQTDLRKIGRATFPKDSTNCSFMGTFEGPLVMQVLSVTNLNQPSIRQDANDANRLLSVRLSDGVNKATGLEYRRIDGLR